MPKPVKLIVYGKPCSKARPRVVKRGNRVSTYDPKQKEKESVMLVAQSVAAKRSDLPLTGSLILTLYSYQPIPKATAKKWIVPMDKGLIVPDNGKDFDNIAKFYCDAMNGAIYVDDRQIAEAHIYKRYSTTPRVEIMVTQIAEEMAR